MFFRPVLGPVAGLGLVPVTQRNRWKSEDLGSKNEDPLVNQIIWF